uniref:Uncharacterized protein n=1 Tax=Heterorhabditis bacteriophora TaxID=37862 RepID=A0A1I7WB80_HETBA
MFYLFIYIASKLYKEKTMNNNL